MTPLATVLDVALKGAALLGVTAALVFSLRRAPASVRHLAWSAGMGGLVALPLLSLALPWRFEVLPIDRLGLSAPAAEPGGWAPVGDAGSPSGSPSPTVESSTPVGGPTADAPILTAGTDGWTPAAADTPAKGRNVGGILLALWLGGAALVLLRLLVSHISVWRLMRRATPLTTAGWYEPLGRVTERLGLRTPVRLATSERTPMPITCGILRSAIVLPAEAESWSAERREAVLLHELAHVRRGDLATHLLAWLACAVHWFNPLAWAAARRLRHESELACDDLVLDTGTRASDYAGHLLDIVRSAGRSRSPAVAMPLAQRSTFEGRLLTILEPGIARGAATPGRAVTALLPVVLFAVPLAAMGPTRPAEPKTAEPTHEVAAEHAATVAESADPAADFDVESASEMAEALVALSIVAPEAAAEVRAVVQTLAESKTGEPTQVSTAAFSALATALRDPSPQVRSTAAQALGELADPRSVAALSRALREDQSPEVRKMAAWALGEIENPAAVPALSDALRGDRSADVRSMAAWALGEIESEAAVDALGAALRDASGDVRSKAVWALGEIESPRAVPWLVAVLEDGDVEVRRKAAWALGEIEDPAAVRPLGQALRDSDAEVRSTALWALGEIESPEAAPWLITALGDSDPDVRGKAAWALGEIESPAAVEPLARVLTDRNVDVRKTAAWALGEIQPASAPQGLIGATRDDNADVRQTVAWALGEIQDPAAIPALRAMLGDAEGDVRKAALHGLLEMEGALAEDVLIELLRNPDAEVRSEAARALGDKN